MPGEFHEDRWQRTAEDSERRVIPRTPGARDEVMGGMESELVPTQPSQTYPATATIGKSRQLRNETGRKHKEAGRKVISAKKFGFIEQTKKHKRGRLKGDFSRPPVEV